MDFDANLVRKFPRSWLQYDYNLLFLTHRKENQWLAWHYAIDGFKLLSLTLHHEPGFLSSTLECPPKPDSQAASSLVASDPDQRAYQRMLQEAETKCCQWKRWIRKNVMKYQPHHEHYFAIAWRQHPQPHPEQHPKRPQIAKPNFCVLSM